MTKFTASSLFLTMGISLALANDSACFDSTFSLLQAQLADFISGDTSEVKEYKMCSGTEIDIGFPDATFSSFAGGDYPLVAARPNAIISCDGSCILRGGFVQFTAVPNVPVVGNVITGISVENVVVKGFTFTGNIDYDGALAASIAAPGDITFQDCVWKDLVARSVISVGTNLLVPVVLDSTMEVTFQNSIFKNITYANLFALNQVQSLSFRSCIFDNIEATGSVSEFFIRSFSGSSFAFMDNCVSNIMYYTTFLGQNDAPYPSIFNVSNIFGDSVKLIDSNPTLTCDQGLAINTVAYNGAFEDCINIFDASTCSLIPSMSPSISPTTLMPTPMPTTKPTEPTSTGLSLGQQQLGKLALIGALLLTMIM